MYKLFFILFFTVFAAPVFAGNSNPTEKKAGDASKLSGDIILDAKLTEKEWQNAQVLSGFITRDPNPGLVANRTTEIKVLYNKEALYVGAFMHESGEENILRELSQRDNFSNSDYFGVYIDAYKDGINGVGFIVTAAGVQIDSKLSALGEDYSWNAVWKSKTAVTDSGWVVEMEIPYSALRFPDSPEQEWHINFTRSIRRIREVSFWNAVDPQTNGFFNQAGILQGISEIKTPVRLQLYPYLSAYYETKSGNNSYSINGGMDVKYGLSDAFTLDMTLIPDFGQVQSDNQILNVTPFEVFFNEQRQFFTEGTELFNKGNLFYSRRVGGRPLNYFKVASQLEEGEEIIENPDKGNLVNATKISGRTKSGLGIGVFNAVSAPTYAKIRNSEGETRSVQTDPLTNFSVLVLDQNLKNNSYVTLINTNVLRNGTAYDANVIGTQFEVRNKKNFLSVRGGGAYSKKNQNVRDKEGFKTNLTLAKVSGKVTYGAGYNIESDTYDPNDLGFLSNNNEFSKFGYLSYNRYQPIGFLNRFGINFNINQSTLYKPQSFVYFNLNTNGFATTKNFHSFGGGVTYTPTKTYDYFEPRRAGYVLVKSPQTFYNFWISSDYRKTFALDINFGQTLYKDVQGPFTFFTISPRVRVNNQLSFVYRYSKDILQNELGYAILNGVGNALDSIPNYDSDQVYIGTRKRTINEQVLDVNYIFTNKMGITARFRHYWAEVDYNTFYELQPNGDLANSNYKGINSNLESLHNTSFNVFNIDIVFRWVFSPGSEVSIVWKDAILNSRNQLANSYRENLDFTFRSPRSDSFSIKLLYFIDYNNTRKSFRNRSSNTI